MSRSFALVFLALAAMARAQDAPIKVEDVSFTTSVEANAHLKNDSNPGSVSGDGRLRQARTEARGAESDACVSAHARKSYSTAHASGELVRRDQHFLGFELNVNTRAEGGRDERCTRCEGTFCAAPAGEFFTPAEARSTSTATVVYKLASRKGAGTYRFTVVIDDAPAEKSDIKITLRRPQIGDATLTADKPFNFDAKPNDLVRLSVQLTTSARSEDPSKKVAGAGMLKFRVIAEEAPILDAAVNQGFILNGTLTTDREFHAVGLLAAHVDNGLSPHCTGTVVGNSSVLTAAHCVADSKIQDYIKARRLYFVVGNDLKSGIAIPVESSQFPRGEPPEKFQFNEKFNNVLEDDVAIVRTAQPIGIAAIPLYDGNPRLEDNWNQMQLTIVGYGLNPADSTSMATAGVQRKATIPMSNVDNRTFHYAAKAPTAASTCRGDSGGPALYKAADNTFRLVGVTSYGAANCRFGSSMRTDAYLNWIKRYIQ